MNAAAASGCFAPLTTPAANVVGGAGNGWKVAMGLLAFERGASTLGQQIGFRQAGESTHPLDTDQDLGFMRWLTVRVPGDVSRSLLLERPGPPAMDEATAAQVRELVAKGATGGWFGLATDDARKAYELAPNVLLTEEAVEKFNTNDPKKWERRAQRARLPIL